MKRKEKTFVIGILIAFVSIFIIVVCVLSFIRLQTKTQQRAALVRQSLEQMLEAVERQDFEEFEYYFMSHMKRQKGFYDNFQELSDYLGEEIQVRKGKVTNFDFGIDARHYHDVLGMEWEIHSVKGEFKVRIQEHFFSDPGDGVEFIEVIKEGKRIYIGKEREE